MYFTVFLPNLLVLRGSFFFFPGLNGIFFYFLKKKLLGSTISNYCEVQVNKGSTTTPSGNTGKYNTVLYFAMSKNSGEYHSCCTSQCF